MRDQSKRNLFIYTPPTILSRLIRSPVLFLATCLYTSLPPINPPPRSSPAIKIVCISDTHNSSPPLPCGDMLIHAGDLSSSGTSAELQAQIDWLGAQTHAANVVIAGNHDLLLDEGCYARHAGLVRDGAQERGALDWGGVKYVQDEGVSVAVKGRAVRLYGSPWTRSYGNWAFQYAPALKDFWAGKVPTDTEVLVTHGPAKGRCDCDGLGCEALLAELWRVKPRLHVHGHVHAGRGVEILDWGWVQWCHDRIVAGERGWTGSGLLGLAVVMWACVWLGYVVLGRRRAGRTVVVNAAWEGNEGKDIAVIEM